MAHDPLDPQADPFRPPETNTQVSCLHCGEEYDSYQIEWRVERCQDGLEHGFWCCPTSGCDGRGFGFDILPTDPHYQDERGGWVWDDAEGEEDEEGEFDEDDWEEGESDADDEAELDLGDDFVPDEPSADAKRPRRSGNGADSGQDTDELPW